MALGCCAAGAKMVLDGEAHAMNTYTSNTLTCEFCIYWQGKLSSYLGCCDHPINRPSRVPFDSFCKLYTERTPQLSLQSMVRGQPMMYYKP